MEKEDVPDDCLRTSKANTHLQSDFMNSDLPVNFDKVANCADVFSSDTLTGTSIMSYICHTFSWIPKLLSSIKHLSFERVSSPNGAFKRVKISVEILEGLTHHLIKNFIQWAVVMLLTHCTGRRTKENSSPSVAPTTNTLHYNGLHCQPVHDWLSEVIVKFRPIFAPSSYLLKLHFIRIIFAAWGQKYLTLKIVIFKPLFQYPAKFLPNITRVRRGDPPCFGAFIRKIWSQQ